MKYRIRPGVVLAEVCGEYMLLATLDASRHCPYVYQLNETAAAFWRWMAQGLDEDAVVAAAAAEYEAPAALIRRDLRTLAAALWEKGYILAEGETV